jgi:hypothetical protein
VRARKEIARIAAIAGTKRRAGRFARVRRRGHELAAKMTHAARDRRVKREARRAAIAASRAARRAQGLGPASALSDRRVARDLRRSRRHATRATSLALRTRARRVRNAALIVAGTSALAGAAYAGKRKPEPE